MRRIERRFSLIKRIEDAVSNGIKTDLNIVFDNMIFRYLCFKRLSQKQEERKLRK